MKALAVAIAVIFPLWFVTVLFVGAHIWLGYESASYKQQMCKTLSDEVGISVSLSTYKTSGCPDLSH
jgi:hypothetical protein